MILIELNDYEIIRCII